MARRGRRCAGAAAGRQVAGGRAARMLLPLLLAAAAAVGGARGGVASGELDALSADLRAVRSELVRTGAERLEDLPEHVETAFPFHELSDEARELLQVAANGEGGFELPKLAKCTPGSGGCFPWASRFYCRVAVAGACDLYFKLKPGYGDRKFQCSRPSLNKAFCMDLPVEFPAGPVVVPLTLPICLPDVRTLDALIRILSGDFLQILPLLGLA